MAGQLTGLGLVGDSRQRIPSPRRAGIRVRLWAHLNGATLDQALSDGTDPESSPSLAQRSAWLTSPKSRRGLAGAIRRLLNRDEVRRGPSASVTPNRNGLVAARVPLTWVASMLESDRAVSPRGVARVHLLLTHPDSVLFDPKIGSHLAHEAEDILDAMEGREETW